MADHAHVTYKVRHQHQQTEPNGQGSFHDVMHVHYETASGTQAKVKIPMTHYTARNVHDAIMADHDEIEKVNSLQPGAPVPPHQQAQ